MPFRSWCKHCVMGRAQSTPHYHRDHSEDKVPTVSWDYWFIDEKQDRDKDNEEEGEKNKDKGLPIVIWADSMSKGAMAYVVSNKGECEYAIRRGAQDMNKILGYNKLVFRGDQEPALRVMMSRIKMLSGEQCTLEDTPVGESQSNGAVESAVKEIRGMYKTMRSDVETNYGKTIPGSHPIHTWAVRHASSTRFRESMGQDGRTAYSRIKGRNFNKEIVKIGECVWYMKPKSKHKKKGDYGWGNGIWLGVRDESGEYIIGTNRGVLKVRSVRRKGSHEDRWDVKQLDEMKGTPWEPVPGSPGTEMTSRIAPDREEREVIPREEGEVRDARLKEFRIERRDVLDNSPTPGCPDATT